MTPITLPAEPWVWAAYALVTVAVIAWYAWRGLDDEP